MAPRPYKAHLTKSQVCANVKQLSTSYFIGKQSGKIILIVKETIKNALSYLSNSFFKVQKQFLYFDVLEPC